MKQCEKKRYCGKLNWIFGFMNYVFSSFDGVKYIRLRHGWT